jgi:hypothetical protein
MKANSGRILKRALVTGSLALLAGFVALAFLPRASKPLAATATTQPVVLSAFCAPSNVPAGDNWVLLGSFEEFPVDLVASPASDGVTVLELQKISKQAIGVRLSVSSGVQGKLLRVSSPSLGAEVFPELYQGPVPESRTADANFTSEDTKDGSLHVTGQYFVYGYLPQGNSPLAALRIHNRSTGEWYRHEHAIEKAKAEADVKIPDPPSFVEVNVLETLPDTDGNGVPDFADVEETHPPRQEQIGVELKPAENILDIVTVDEAGFASWRLLKVVTSYTPSN